ncbi:MAG TPA: L-aspartate oxidase, partial [Campylobacterales bacterium]|nr:L-aspartate oxidase [Campylobacterales bacterium]
LRNALEVSEAIVLATMKRKESRGSHNRDDYPRINPNMAKSITINEFRPNFFKIDFKEKGILAQIREYILNL